MGLMAVYTLVYSLEGGVTGMVNVWPMPSWHEPMMSETQQTASANNNQGLVVCGVFATVDAVLGVIIASKVYDSEFQFKESIGCRTYEIGKQVVLFWVYLFMWIIMLLFGLIRFKLLDKFDQKARSRQLSEALRSQFALTYKIGVNNSLLKKGDSSCSTMPAAKPGPSYQAGREEWRRWIELYYPATTCYDLDEPGYLDELIEFLWEQTREQRRTSELDQLDVHMDMLESSLNVLKEEIESPGDISEMNEPPDSPHSTLSPIPDNMNSEQFTAVQEDSRASQITCEDREASKSNMSMESNTLAFYFSDDEVCSDRLTHSQLSVSQIIIHAAVSPN